MFITIVQKRYIKTYSDVKGKPVCLLISHKLTVNDLVKYILPYHVPLITSYFKNISIKLIKALLVDKNNSCCHFFWSY